MTRSVLISMTIAAGLGSLLSTGNAQAAALRISPVGVDLKATERAGSITIVNSDSQPVNLQLRAYKWSQPEEGGENLEETNELIVSPPAITVPAGASYTVRVARLAVAPVDGELAYRLLIDELPRPDDPRTLGQGVKMVLRTSLPVFVTDTKAMADLEWTVWQDQAGVHAQAHNRGKRHAKLANLTLRTAAGGTLNYGGGLNGYVLQNATRTFTLANQDAAPGTLLTEGSTVRLSAQNDALDETASVVVGRR